MVYDITEICESISRVIHVPERLIEFDQHIYVFRCHCGLCNETWTAELIEEAFMSSDDTEQLRLQGLMWYYHRNKVGRNLFVVNNMMCYELGRRSGLMQTCNDCEHRYRCITNSFILV